MIERLRLGSKTAVFRSKLLVPDGVRIVSPLFRRGVIFACIFKLFIFCRLQSSILRNLFAFKCLPKKEGGVGYLFLAVRTGDILGGLKGLSDFKCFDGHESIVRVSAN